MDAHLDPAPPTVAPAPPPEAGLVPRLVAFAALAAVAVIVVAAPTIARHGISVGGRQAPWPVPVPEYECTADQGCSIDEIAGGLLWLVMSGAAVVMAFVAMGLAIGRPERRRARRPGVLVLAGLAVLVALTGVGTLNQAHLDGRASGSSCEWDEEAYELTC